MADPAELIARLRSRLRADDDVCARVEAALRDGHATAEAALAAAGLDLQQIARVLADEPAPQDAPDHTMLEEATVTVTTVGEEPSVDDLVARLVDMTPRFELQGELARGAMGRILAAWDLHLGRPVAIKILRKAGARDLDRVRFLEEAQVTGQLQHPSIMPVYELGRLRDQVAFVMKRVEGRSLKDIIGLLRRDDPEAARQYGRMKLLGIFHQLCLAVAYAHTRGVVHRDLKPSNVMVGDFGEVVLLDWGLCKVVGQATRSTRSTSERWKTVHGQIIGTPAYMAPEQAMGIIDQIDARTDVYGLGAILYHLLTLRPPFSGKTNREIVNRVLKESVAPLRERAPEQGIPEALEALVLRCLARDPADRFRHARALADAVSDYLLSGEGATRDVEPLVREGVAAIAQHESLLEDHALASDSLMTARAAVAPDDPPDVKAPVWTAEASLRALQVEIADARGRALTALMRAVTLDPRHAEARRLLCDLLLARHDAALSRADAADVAWYGRLVRDFDDGRYRRFVDDPGSLNAELQPRGATVALARFEDRARRLEPGDAVDLGPAPVHVEDLEAGVYLLVARAAGRSPLRTTVVVRPGRCTRVRLRMLEDGVVPPGFVHVPAGTFLYGSNRNPYAAPGEQALPDFLVATAPITAGAYLEFLRDIAVADPVAAAAHAPRGPGGTVLWPADAAGVIHLPQTGPWAWREDLPVVGVSAADAQAYCRWATEVEGVVVRLPSEEEWEKAARGTEGRAFPWGNDWEPAYAAGPALWPGPLPPPVGAVPHDRSPFGLLDCAGGVREWTATADAGRGEGVVVRGGSFLTGDEEGRPLWTREVVAADRRALDIGFRVARDARA